MLGLFPSPKDLSIRLKNEGKKYEKVRKTMDHQRITAQSPRCWKMHSNYSCYTQIGQVPYPFSLTFWVYLHPQLIMLHYVICDNNLCHNCTNLFATSILCHPQNIFINIFFSTSYSWHMNFLHHNFSKIFLKKIVPKKFNCDVFHVTI